MAAQAQTILEESPQRSLLLSLEALDVTLGVGDSRVSAAENSLRQALSSVGSTLLIGHQKDVRITQFSPDGQWLATASTDGTVRLWQVDDPQNVVILRGNEEPIKSLALSSDRQWLATGDKAGTVQLWRMNDLTGEPMELAEHDGPVYVVVFSPDAGRLAAAGEDGVVRLWRMDDPTADSVVITEDGEPIRGLAFGPDGRWLAVGGHDGAVRLWQVDGPVEEPVATLQGHQDVVELVVFGPNKDWLATASWEGLVRLWDVSQIFDTRIREAEINSIELEHLGTVRAIAFSSDGHWLATGSDDRMVRMWNLSMDSAAESPPTESDAAPPPPTSGNKVNLHLNPPALRYGHEGAIVTISFDPNGHWLATGSTDRTVRLWMVENPGAEAVVLRGHEAPVSAVAFSPDGRWLVTGSRDTAMRWDLEDLAEEPEELYGYKSLVTQIAFSPDGHWLAIGGRSRSVHLWDMSDLDKGLMVLAGHESPVTSIAFNSDGRWLATGSDDRTARLWDMNDPSADPVVLSGHENLVTSVAFSPDERWLSTGSRDGTARLWTLSLDELIELDCLSAGRNLTYEEWQWYVRQSDELYQKTCDNLPISITAIDEVISQAEDSFFEGDTEIASLMYEQAQQWVHEIGDASYHHEVCWSGSMYGFAQVVMTACYHAVESEPQNEIYHYSRGLARALTGDYAGVIEDLNFIIEQGEDEGEEDIDPEQINDWIAELEAGQNPFTEELLERLR